MKRYFQLWYGVFIYQQRGTEKALVLLGELGTYLISETMASSSPFLVMLSMCLLICCSEAKQYVVGGTANSWKTPLSSPDSLNHWANSHHFKIGDTLGIPFSYMHQCLSFLLQLPHIYLKLFICILRTQYLNTMRELSQCMK